MKFVKKLTCLFLAIVMTMAMGITAFAEETPATYTITGPKDGHTYKVYQIFTGDLANGVLSNIKAGTNYNTEKGDAAKAAEAIQALKVEGQALANAIAEYVTFSSPVGSLTDSQDYTGPAGYYLIKDAGKSDMTGDSYSTYVVKVVGNVTVTTKKDVPSFEKKIKDTNDTTGETSGWQDSADYDIGDSVPFKLEGTVASNYASYTTYKFIFHDKEEQSLTFQNVTSVYVLNGETKTTIDADQYTVTSSGLTDGCTFEVSFSNLKNISAVTAGSKIVVEYTSKLNDKAVLGSQGNVNQAKLEYSNNPNNSQGGDNDDHGETPWDNVIVFTYKVVVNKVDANNDALAGAAFKLEKKIKATAEGAEDTWTTVKEFQAGTDTSFTFSGLDDGDYRITETTTPAGYNTIDPITFTVTASHTIEWTTGERKDVLTSLSGDKASGGVTFTASKSEGSLTTSVVNKKGSELPSTGGMGTTVLYIAGIAMIVVAGVVVIARKRAI